MFGFASGRSKEKSLPGLPGQWPSTPAKSKSKPVTGFGIFRFSDSPKPVEKQPAIPGAWPNASAKKANDTPKLFSEGTAFGQCRPPSRK